MKYLLCFLGLHKWRRFERGGFIYRKCERCRRLQMWAGLREDAGSFLFGFWGDLEKGDRG